jgi:TonB family protein
MSDPLPAYSVRDFYWACAGSVLAHLLVFMTDRVVQIPVMSLAAVGDVPMAATLRAANEPRDQVPPGLPAIIAPEIGKLGDERLVSQKSAMVFAKNKVSTVAFPLLAEKRFGLMASAPVPAETEMVEATAADVALYRLSLARASRHVAGSSSQTGGLPWEGRVVLSIDGVAGGGVPRVSLNKSSGITALDDHAREMMNQAVQLAPVPERLNRRRFAVVVPIEFSLTE